MHVLAEASLAAVSGQAADARDAEIDAALLAMLETNDGPGLAAVFASAPAVRVYRHLWRALARCFHAGTATDAGVVATTFALPLVLVAAQDAPREGPATLPGVLDDTEALALTLREHRALAGNQTFALSNALCGADALDLARLPGWFARAALPSTGNIAPASLSPLPIDVAGTTESVHLRFVVGTAIAAPGADLLRDASVGAWGMPVAQALGRQLAIPGVTVLALPRAPQSLVTVVHQGRAAQREVTAQLFASNAIRKLRASVGEPTAVVSAHRSPNAPGGGELRLSLSSPFDPREAEGFRCPLYPPDRVGDVVMMLVDLLHDCRVTDIRALDGVHADRDAATGLTLLFKSETIPPAAPVTMQ